MSDIAVNQTAGIDPNAGAPKGALPDVDDLFGKPDVDELFPATPAMRNFSPIHDSLFANSDNAQARILDAFGQGFAQDWGAGEQEHQQDYSEADQWLRKAGLWNDYAKGQHSIIKAANEVLMRPAVSALTALLPMVTSAASGVFHGAQTAVAQAGTEVGAPELGRELAAIPEAFPTDIGESVGVPHHLPEPIAEAKSLDVIGAGEGGYFGTSPVEHATPDAQARAAAITIKPITEQEAAPGASTKVTPSPAAQPPAEEPATAQPPAEQPAADIHAVARQIAPQTFAEFDALAQKKDTFRRWIGELRDVRDQEAAENAPHQAEIADLQERLQDATPRLAKKYQTRLDPLLAEREDYIAAHTQGDSADMAKVRQQLMQADYRMRDLAPEVTAAYRQAAERMPGAETVEPEVVPTAGTPENEETAPANIGEAPQVAGEGTPAPSAEIQQETPTPQAGMIRFYHGGSEPATGGPRWLTPHEQYARNFGIGNKEVHFVDIPKEQALQHGGFDEINGWPINFEAPEEIAKQLRPAGQQPAREAAAVPAPATETAASFPIAHAPSIVADVAQKLTAAGRPADEAEATAQLVGAYWETRAARFEGRKGTAAEMYAREAPEVVAGKERPSKAKRELELAQSRVDRGGRSLPVTTVDPHTPLVAVELNDLPQRSRAQAIDEIKRLAGKYETRSGQQVTVNANTTRKAFSGSYVNDIKKSLAGELGRIIEHSVIYGGAGDFDYAVAHLRLDGDDVAARLILKKVAGESRLYQFEGLDLENTNPGAKAGIGEQTIAVHTPDGALPLRGLPAQSRNVGDLVSVFNRHEPGVETLFQGVQGRIRIRDDARNTITLMKSADASTFIHETGHDWLDRMLADARDSDAPADLKQDSDTVLKWLGVDSPDAVKTRHHEKFARGFETYMMEGRAPSAALARVFAKFKTWLITIYKTVSALKAPISDDIRAVFDRLLSEAPQKTVIAPERETAASPLAAAHEPLVETTPPQEAFGVAGRVEAERDSNFDRNLLNDQHNDARLSDTGAEAQRRAPRGTQPPGDADAAGLERGAAGTSGGSGAERAGGGETPDQGAGLRKGTGAIGLNKAPTPLINFLASRGGLKASDDLIADLRQALGAKNHYVPGFGQLIRVPKQLSAAARKSGRLESMSLDRAATAAVEAGLLPEGSGPRELIDAIEKEARGETLPFEKRPEDAAERAQADHTFLETVNDRLKEAGGFELSDAERQRVLDLHNREGLDDPTEIIERLALESYDETADGSAAEAQGIEGWDVPAPDWDLSDDGRGASSEGGRIAEGRPEQPSGTTPRGRGPTTAEFPLDANVDIPRSASKLIDKAGNIRLDNLNTPDDINAVIRATAEELSPFEPAITRGRISDAETLRLADALGMDAAKLSQRKIGEAFNAEQIIALRKLLIESAGQVRDAAAQAADGSDADVLAYAEAADRHRMIQEHVMGVTAEAGRALRAFRDLAGAKQARDVAAIVQEGTGRTLYQLRNQAAKISALDTTAKVSKFVRESEKKGLFDWIQSLFVNALISGPLTHAGYTAAGEMFALFRAVGETGASALVGQLRQLANYGPAERADIAEMPHQLYGMYRGARNGIRASWQAWKANRVILPAEVERQTSLPGITGQDVGIHQTIPNPEIAGRTIPIGTVLESPGRLVAALHSFNWTTFYSQSMAAQAFRQAMAEKLEGQAFATRVAELTQNPTDEMIKLASEEANGGALMQKPAYDSLTGQISRFTNTGWKLPDIPLPAGHALPLGTLRPFKFIDPFVTIQSNVQRMAFGRGTPLALFKQSVRDDLSMKNGGVAFDLAAGKILAGTSVMIGAGALAAEGLLNNSGPSDPKQARAWQKVYGLPHGLNIGDTSFDVLRLGNLGLQMSIAADLYHAAHIITSEDAHSLAGELVHAFTQNILDESSMRGPAELFQVVEDHDRYGPAWVRNFASSVMPFSVGLGQIARQVDPYSRNARTVMDAIKAKLPLESQTLTPRRDVWGEPVPNRGWFLTYYQHVGHDPVDNALYQLHIYPSLPHRKIRGVQLTDQQYDDYSRISGRLMKLRLNAFVNTPGFAVIPNSIKTQQIVKIMRSSREAARAMIMMENPDIIKQASVAKRAKVTGEPVLH